MKFELTEQEAQIVVEALAELPLKISLGVFQKIQAQAAEQMQPKQPAFNMSVPASDKAV